MPYRSATSDTVILGSWSQSTNDVMVSSASMMLVGLSINRNQILSAGERNDIPGDTKPRLCLSYMIYGLMTSELMDGGEILPPLIADLLPCFERRQGTTEQDFDKDLGSIDITPIIEMVYIIITYMLERYKYVFLDGFSVLDAFLSFFESNQDEWVVVQLGDEMIDLFDSGVFDRSRDRTGHDDCVHVLLVQNIETENFVIIHATYQMASTIERMSTLRTNFVFIYIIHLSSSILNYQYNGNSFIKVFDKTIGSFIQVSVGMGRTESRPLFGRELEFFYQSTLRHLLVKGEAQQYVDVLHGAGILRPGTKFYPPNVTGRKRSSIYILTGFTSIG
jgi:hypothetical protein